MLERDAEAVEALQKSLAIKKTARALNSLGVVHAYEGKDKDAVGNYEQAVEMEPGNYKYQLNLADAYRRLGRRDDALLKYQEGNELVRAELEQNDMDPIRAFSAYFRLRLGDVVGAEQEIAEAWNHARRDRTVIWFAILVYEAMGQRDRAVEIARCAPRDLLRELRRHPDLAEFSRDPRYVQLLEDEKGRLATHEC